MTNQEDNNRSLAQRIRRMKENMGGLIETQEQQGQVFAQHDRDIKFVKSDVRSVEARVAALENEKSSR